MSRLRRRWVPVSVGAVFVGLVVNVGVQEGFGVLMPLGLAVVGGAVAWAVPGYVAGHSAASHSLQAKRVIEAHTNRKELTR